jgi:hypothetical protein
MIAAYCAGMLTGSRILLALLDALRQGAGDGWRPDRFPSEPVALRSSESEADATAQPNDSIVRIGATVYPGIVSLRGSNTRHSEPTSQPTSQICVLEADKAAIVERGLKAHQARDGSWPLVTHFEADP